MKGLEGHAQMLTFILKAAGANSVTGPKSSVSLFRAQLYARKGLMNPFLRENK